MKETLSIILPTYNERETICRLIQKILDVVSSMNVDTEILVVDDSSPDGTAQTVRKAFQQNPSVQVISRKDPRSLGGSVKDGIRAASGDLVLIMDADFNHAPEDILRLMAARDRAALINGSRFLRGGGMEKAKLRFWGSKVFNSFGRFVLGLRVTDVLSGFILARKNDLMTLDLDKIFTGYGDFGIRFHYAVKRKRLSVLEIPVLYPQRLGGSSKTRFLKHTWQYFLSVLKTRFLFR